MFEKVNIASLNCRGLNQKNKILQIFDLVELNKIDILFLQETHLDSYALIEEYKNFLVEKHYVSFWTINEDKTKGVAVIFRDLFFQDYDSLNLKFIENRVISIDLKFKDILFNLVNIYAPNLHEDQFDFIDKLYNITNNKKNIILGGDFNIDLSKKNAKNSRSWEKMD